MQRVKSVILIVFLVCLVGYLTSMKYRTVEVEPIVASGHQVMGEAVSLDIPQGWQVIDDILTVDEENIVLSGEDITVNVIVNHIPEMINYTVDEMQALLQDKLLDQELGDVTIKNMGQEQLEIGEGVYFEIEGIVTAHLIEENKKSGIYEESVTHIMEEFLDETLYELIYYIRREEQLIIIDGVTYKRSMEDLRDSLEFITTHIYITN